MTPISAARNFATDPLPDIPPENVIFGSSIEMNIIAERINRIAKVNVPVLITGESGTGKELIARVIHLRSPFSSGRFVRLNCVGASQASLEQALADTHNARLVDPDRSTNDPARTVFFDEIGELDAQLQALMVALLSNSKAETFEAHPRTRIICATTHDLRKRTEERLFRSDLLNKIDTVRLRVPPLRERAQDIATIANYLLEIHTARLNTPARHFSHAAINQLTAYKFPWNIRELENITIRYAVLGDEEELIANLMNPDLFEFTVNLADFKNKPMRDAVKHTVAHLESTIIRSTLARNGWNRRRTAKQLDISYRSLLYKISEYGIPHLRSVNISRSA